MNTLSKKDSVFRPHPAIFIKYLLFSFLNITLFCCLFNRRNVKDCKKVTGCAILNHRIEYKGGTNLCLVLS